MATCSHWQSRSCSSIVWQKRCIVGLARRKSFSEPRQSMSAHTGGALTPPLSRLLADLAGKAIVVTGATSGLGRCIALACAGLCMVGGSCSQLKRVFKYEAVL